MTQTANMNFRSNAEVLASSKAFAGERFSEVVRNIQNRDGIDFMAAWEKAKVENRRLYERMAEAPVRDDGEKIQALPAAQAFAGERFSEVVRNIRNRDGVDFMAAWERAKAENRRLYERMAGDPVRGIAGQDFSNSRPGLPAARQSGLMSKPAMDRFARLVKNRGFSHPTDGWYQIEPKGEHPNLRSGIVQVIDDEAVRLIVEDFNRAAAVTGFAGMLIDIEHFKHDAGKETRAYGWLMELANRADGISGRIEWTRTGQASVDGGDYRFFSTEYKAEDLDELPGTSALPRVRPTRLGGLTLTNDPNNKGGRPITNRIDGSTDPSYRR